MNDVIVTNMNDFYHEDRFDGHQFGFPPREKVLVPEVAATHMLGFNRADKTETLTRLGWANLESDKGVQQLAKFVFTRAIVIEQPIEVEAGGEAPPVVVPRSSEEAAEETV